MLYGGCVRLLHIKHIASHCLPPEPATKFAYFTLIPSPMPPKVEKRQNIHWNVLLKLELMKNRKVVVLQQTFSSNRPPFPFYNLLNWGLSVSVFLCIYLCWQVPGHSRSISICCFCLYKSSLHTPFPLLSLTCTSSLHIPLLILTYTAILYPVILLSVVSCVYNIHLTFLYPHWNVILLSFMAHIFSYLPQEQELH